MPMNVLNDIKIGQELFYDKSTYMQELNKINIMEKLEENVFVIGFIVYRLVYSYSRHLISFFL